MNNIRKIAILDSSFKVANEFIRFGLIEGVEVTPMKLQKLCYFAYGWYAGFMRSVKEGDSPDELFILFDEDICAWKYGPVIKTVYNKFSSYKNSSIKTYAFSESHAYSYSNGQPIQNYVPSEVDFFLPRTKNEDFELALSVIQKVWETYKNFNGVELSVITHMPKSPWDITYNTLGGRRNIDMPIDPLMIAEYFKELFK